MHVHVPSSSSHNPLRLQGCGSSHQPDSRYFRSPPCLPKSRSKSPSASQSASAKDADVDTGTSRNGLPLSGRSASVALSTRSKNLNLLSLVLRTKSASPSPSKSTTAGGARVIHGVSCAPRKGLSLPVRSSKWPFPLPLK